MDTHETLSSVSNMAKNKASREIREAMDIEDPVECTLDLITKSTRPATVMDGLEHGTPKSLHEFGLFNAGFKRGIKLTIQKLIEAGLPEDQLPIAGLAEKAYSLSIRNSSALEADYEGDLADLYLPEDGGNG